MIGHILADRRRALGISQKALAEALGVSPTYLCDMELGRRAFPASRVEALPEGIRAAVAQALIDAQRDEIARLARFVEGDAA